MNKTKTLVFVGIFVSAFLPFTQADNTDQAQTVSNQKQVKGYLDNAKKFHDSKDYDPAIMEYSKAIGADPKEAMAYGGRGLMYLLKGQYDSAIIDLNKALELNGDYGEAYFGRAIALQQNGEQEKALQDIEKAKSLGYPVSSDFYESFKNEAAKKDRTVNTQEYKLITNNDLPFIWIALDSLKNKKIEDIPKDTKKSLALCLMPGYTLNKNEFECEDIYKKLEPKINQGLQEVKNMKRIYFKYVSTLLAYNFEKKAFLTSISKWNALAFSHGYGFNLNWKDYPDEASFSYFEFPEAEARSLAGKLEKSRQCTYYIYGTIVKAGTRFVDSEFSPFPFNEKHPVLEIAPEFMRIELKDGTNLGYKILKKTAKNNGVNSNRD